MTTVGDGASRGSNPDGDSPSPLTDRLKAAHLRRARVELEVFLASGATLRFDDSTAEPLVSVVLVVHNRAELTLRCLLSLARELPFALEILVVDNASTDATRKLLRKLDGVRVLRNSENVGFPRAVNQAAAAARGKYLLLLNNDTEVLAGSLEAAAEQLRTGENVGAVVGRIVLLDGTLQEAGSLVWNDGSALGYGRGSDPSSWEYLFRRDVDFGSAAFLLTDRRVFLELGGLDEGFSPAYYEDLDYCFRLRASGLRTVYEPRAVIVHFEYGTSGLIGDALRMQGERRARFVAKHATAVARRLAPSPGNVVTARFAELDQPRILVLDDRVPRSWLGSGFPRSLDLLRGLKALGYSVTFYPLSVVEESLDTLYEEVPREIEVVLGAGVAGLPGFLAGRSGYYTRVLVSREHNLRRLRPHLGLLGGAGVVYDSEAVGALREAARRSVGGRPLAESEMRRMLADELSPLEDVDAVIAVSESERRLIGARSHRPVGLVRWVCETRPGAPELDNRDGLLFLAGILDDESPNADALEWLVREIHPRVRKLAARDVPLTVVGPNLVPRLRQLTSPGLRSLGVVRDLGPVFEGARVFVAPTRFAAGLPHKVHQAASYGVPVVCTSLLAEQLGWRAGTELLVADDAATLAGQCVRLLTDDDLWRSLRANALERLEREGSRAAFLAALAEILAAADPGRRWKSAAAAEVAS